MLFVRLISLLVTVVTHDGVVSGLMANQVESDGSSAEAISSLGTSSLAEVDYPRTYDWQKDRDVISPVISQGSEVFASMVKEAESQDFSRIFASVSAIETMYFLKHGRHVKLSEVQVVHNMIEHCPRIDDLDSISSVATNSGENVFIQAKLVPDIRPSDPFLEETEDLSSELSPLVVKQNATESRHSQWSSSSSEPPRDYCSIGSANDDPRNIFEYYLSHELRTREAYAIVSRSNGSHEKVSKGFFKDASLPPEQPHDWSPREAGGSWTCSLIGNIFGTCIDLCSKYCPTTEQITELGSGSKLSTPSTMGSGQYYQVQAGDDARHCDNELNLMPTSLDANFTRTPRANHVVNHTRTPWARSSHDGTSSIPTLQLHMQHAASPSDPSIPPEHHQFQGHGRHDLTFGNREDMMKRPNHMRKDDLELGLVPGQMLGTPRQYSSGDFDTESERFSHISVPKQFQMIPEDQDLRVRVDHWFRVESSELRMQQMIYLHGPLVIIYKAPSAFLKRKMHISSPSRFADSASGTQKELAFLPRGMSSDSTIDIDTYTGGIFSDAAQCIGKGDRAALLVGYGEELSDVVLSSPVSIPSFPGQKGSHTDRVPETHMEYYPHGNLFDTPPSSLRRRIEPRHAPHSSNSGIVNHEEDDSNSGSPRNFLKSPWSDTSWSVVNGDDGRDGIESLQTPYDPQASEHDGRLVVDKGNLGSAMQLHSMQLSHTSEPQFMQPGSTSPDRLTDDWTIVQGFEEATDSRELSPSSEAPVEASSSAPLDTRAVVPLWRGVREPVERQKPAFMQIKQENCPHFEGQIRGHQSEKAEARVATYSSRTTADSSTVGTSIDSSATANHLTDAPLQGAEKKETPTKFWRLKNFEGPDWGEDGYFRLVRGNALVGERAMCGMNLHVTALTVV